MQYHLPLPEWVTALLIHLLVPLAGIIVYVRLCRRLSAQGESPVVLLLLFLLFFCWGGVLLVALTELFWYWSGMASLGTFFLLLISPFIVLPATIGVRHLTRDPAVAEGAWLSCLLYYLLLGSALVFFLHPWAKHGKRSNQTSEVVRQQSTH
jgi:hypothetical protein